MSSFFGLWGLCAAAFMLAVLLTAVLCSGAPAALKRFASRLGPQHRASLWLGLSTAPCAAGTVILAASLLPSLGIGSDHCFAHGNHHLHLCFAHFGGQIGPWVSALALITSACILRSISRVFRAAYLTHKMRKQLSGIGCAENNLLVVPFGTPQAFVLGALRPQIVVSQGLRALSPNIVESVLEHERAHVRNRDVLWRVVRDFFGAFHLPQVDRYLRAKYHEAQEMTADAEASEHLSGGRLQLAESLIAVVRSMPSHAPGVAFAHGDLRARVHELLTHEAPQNRPVSGLSYALLSFAFLVACVLSDSIHHGLETLLGVLS